MRLRRTLVTAALGGTLALTAMASSAQAAPAAQPKYAAADTITKWAPTPPVYYSAYSTRAECENAGINGDIHGRWTWWSCSRALRGYELWVIYS
ncbi:hypothetical protein AB0M05_18800 [Streptomyces violaceusniger]|uniref:hypothetical protein n=1 Tax=Streptomyces violaceusniger TaxID=68280 RepID=UPI003419096F